jgi:hypothetical protein
MPLVSFSPGQVIKSADANANWGLCVLTDTSRTVTVTHTYTATQTFTGGWTAGSACSISTGGFTVTAGGITITAGSLTLGDTASKIVPGATSLALRNNADSQNNVLITDAGVVTIRGLTTISTGGLLVSSGGIVVTANGVVVNGGGISCSGTLTMVTAVSKLIPGSTSLSLRNNADSIDNLLLPDNGVAVFRNGVSAGGIITSTSGGFDATTSGPIYKVSGTQVVSARVTGYAAMAGTPDKASTFATSTVTLAQLAGRVMQLQADFTSHGLIGA